MLLLICIFVILSGNIAFLLNGPSNKTSDVFVTQGEFVSEKHLLQRETESLRHDVDVMIATLTSQLNQKFTEIQNQMQGTSLTTPAPAQSFVPLSKYRDLEDKYAKLQNQTDNLKLENQGFHRELTLLRNQTLTDIAALQNLRNLQPLIDLASLQKTVNDNTVNIHSLSAKEQSRSQDFIALYNQLNSIVKIANDFQVGQTKTNADLMNNISSVKNETLALIQDAEQRLTYLNSNGTIQQKVDELAKFLNSTDEQVALTSYPASATVSGSNVKFDKLGYSVGVQNLDAIKSTGKFKCEKAGLYLIAVSVASKDTYPYFCILNNAIELACTDVGQKTSSTPEIWHSGSTIVVNYLDVNDEVWVRPDQLKTIESEKWSQFTIVKIR